MGAKSFIVNSRAFFGVFVLAVAWDLCGQFAAYGQQQDPANVATKQSPENNVPLSIQQESIRQRFQRFEKTMRQMGEYLRKKNPERANLLGRALQRGQEDRLYQRMSQVIVMLENGEFGAAVEEQEILLEYMQNLLKVLLSEDRRNEIENEEKRLKELIGDINKVMAAEKSIRAGTERGADAKRINSKQEKTARETKDLADKIKQQDKERNGSSEESDPEGNQGDNPKESSKNDSRDGDSKNRSPKDGNAEKGKPQDPSQGGEPKGGKSASESQNQTPGRKQVEQAHREMERAIEAMKKQQRDDASEHQDEAISKLREAKEKLEELLRQLREEEQSLLLTSLEARFWKMLEIQTRIHEGTIDLSKTNIQEWKSRHFDRARELSREEETLVLEVTKSLALLREEGTSVAFPEALEDIRADMQTVSQRLENNQVAELTQSIERDILEAIQELLDAIRQEIEKKKEEQNSQQQGQGQQGQPSDPGLIDALAELKILRAMQVRIKRRTTRLGQMRTNDLATDADIAKQLAEISRRQARLQKSTYLLSTGRNRLGN